MKRKIYLHCGMHKTGTSAIQKWAKQNRATLLKSGVLYPDYSPYAEMKINGHMQFTHAIANKKSQLTLEECKNLVKKWKSDADKHNCDLLISAESIFRHFLKSTDMDPKTAYLRRVKDLFYDFDVEPIIVFRRPDSFIESFYKETVSKPAPPLPRLSEWAQTKFHLNYTENFYRYEQVFGNVHVLIYENLQERSNFVKGFFDDIGLHVNGDFKSEQVRKSLSVSQTILKNYANQYIKDRTENERFTFWLKKNNRLIDDAFGDDVPSLWESPEEHSQFLRNFPFKKFYDSVGITSNSDKFPQYLETSHSRFNLNPPQILISMVDEYFL